MYVSCWLTVWGIRAGEGNARGGTEGCYAGEAAALAIPAVTGFPTAGVRTAAVGIPPLALREKVRSFGLQLSEKSIFTTFRYGLNENVEF